MCCRGLSIICFASALSTAATRETHDVIE
jgi:hypothetical protein